MFSYYFDVLIFKIILKNKIIYIILMHFSTKKYFEKQPHHNFEHPLNLQKY
jgi:hypothetical protein